jgi:hypothetical protein
MCDKFDYQCNPVRSSLSIYNIKSDLGEIVWGYGLGYFGSRQGLRRALVKTVINFWVS